jgi:Flp pilus assembly protein TadD
LTEATSLYEKARRLDPKVQIDCKVLGTLYARQGDFSQAIREYLVASQKAPYDAELLNDLAFAYGQLGDLAKSEKSYRRALEVTPDYPQAHTNLAILLAQQNRLEESLEQFTQAVGPAAAHSNLGAILIGQGRHDEAEQYLQQALALDTTLAPVPQMLAKCRSRRAALSAEQAVPVAYFATDQLGTERAGHAVSLFSKD